MFLLWLLTIFVTYQSVAYLKHVDEGHLCFRLNAEPPGKLALQGLIPDPTSPAQLFVIESGRLYETSSMLNARSVDLSPLPLGTDWLQYLAEKTAIFPKEALVELKDVQRDTVQWMHRAHFNASNLGQYVIWLQEADNRTHHLLLREGLNVRVEKLTKRKIAQHRIHDGYVIHWREENIALTRLQLIASTPADYLATFQRKNRLKSLLAGVSSENIFWLDGADNSSVVRLQVASETEADSLPQQHLLSTLPYTFTLNKASYFLDPDKSMVYYLGVPKTPDATVFDMVATPFHEFFNCVKDKYKPGGVTKPDAGGEDNLNEEPTTLWSPITPLLVGIILGSVVLGLLLGVTVMAIIIRRRASSQPADPVAVSTSPWTQSPKQTATSSTKKDPLEGRFLLLNQQHQQPNALPRAQSCTSKSPTSKLTSTTIHSTTPRRIHSKSRRSPHLPEFKVNFNVPGGVAAASPKKRTPKRRNFEYYPSRSIIGGTN